MQALRFLYPPKMRQTTCESPWTVHCLDGPRLVIWLPLALTVGFWSRKNSLEEWRRFLHFLGGQSIWISLGDQEPHNGAFRPRRPSFPISSVKKGPVDWNNIGTSIEVKFHHNPCSIIFRVCSMSFHAYNSDVDAALPPPSATLEVVLTTPNIKSRMTGMLQGSKVNK